MSQGPRASQDLPLRCLVISIAHPSQEGDQTPTLDAHAKNAVLGGIGHQPPTALVTHATHVVRRPKRLGTNPG